MIRKQSENIIWYGWSLLENRNIQAGVTCRRTADGGDFNLALHTPGPKETVLKNRKDFARALGRREEDLTAAEQVHGRSVRVLTGEDRGRGAFSRESALQDTDALVLTDPALLGVIFTADCLPVILFDPHRRIGGVIHAGWKGAAAGIVTAALEKIRGETGSPAGEILAVTGPAIGSCCYQVDRPVFDAMTGRFPETGDAFIPDGPDHWRFSLEEAVRRQLLTRGVREEHIETAGICTCCSGEFFSWRGDGPDTGRMATFLTIGKEQT